MRSDMIGHKEKYKVLPAFMLAVLLASLLLGAGACSSSGGTKDASAYLGDYSYNSPISAMVYEDMDGEGEGIQYRTVTDYEKMIAYSPVPVCLYFYAGPSSDTMGAAAIVEQLAETYHGRVLFVSVDAELEKNLVSHFQIDALPDFVLLQNGSWTASFSSFDGQSWTGSDLEKWIIANSSIS